MAPLNESGDHAPEGVLGDVRHERGETSTAREASGSGRIAEEGVAEPAKTAGTPAPKERPLFRGKSPQWQWKDDTDVFRPYEKDENRRIEAQFQKGTWMIRMKSVQGKKPREIYFYDMCQYNPVSQKSREIRRVPEMHRAERFARMVNTMLLGFIRGDQGWWKPKTLADFQHARKDISDDAAGRIYEMQDSDRLAARIVNTCLFSTLSVFMIICNTVYIWVEADYNDGMTIMDTPQVFILFDNVFCVWFIVELTFRFLALKRKRDLLRDRWLMLDVFIVGLMVLDTWVFQLVVYNFSDDAPSAHLEKLSMFRGCRFLRLARVARLFKVFPQLFILVNGMLLAMSAMFHTVLLLFLLTYTFAIVFKQMSAYSEGLVELQYSSVGGAFWNLMIYGTFLDSVGQMLDGLKEANLGIALLFLIYVLISNLTLLNMLIGILYQELVTVSEKEKTLVDERELQQSLTELFKFYDMNADQRLNRAEFDMLLGNAEFNTLLKAYKIDVDELEKLRDVFFTHEGRLDSLSSKKENDGKSPFSEVVFTEERQMDDTSAYSELKFNVFVEKVMQLRGGNTATVHDMVDLRNWLEHRLSDLASIAAPAAVAEQCKSQQASLAPSPDEARIGGSKAILPQRRYVTSPLANASPLTAGFEQAVMEKLAAIRLGQETLEAESCWMKVHIHELQRQMKLTPQQEPLSVPGTFPPPCSLGPTTDGPLARLPAIEWPLVD